MKRLDVERSSEATTRMVKDASTPLYKQLCDFLIGDITDRKLAPGHRLPGEHGMCQLYGVSRTVVRQALAQLEHDGVIERVKGKGTFVARHKVSEGLLHTLSGLYEEVGARGGKLHSEVRQQTIGPASEVVAEALQVGPGEPVVVLERLRYVEDAPWSLTTTYLRSELAPLVLPEDFRHQSLYALLDQHGIRAEHGVRSVEISSATAGQAAALGTAKGAPLMLLKSTTYDRSNTPIEFFMAYHRGDQSRFEFRLHASSPERHHALRRVPTGL